MRVRVALQASTESTRLAMVRAFGSAPASWDVFLWTATADPDVLVSDVPQDGTIAFDLDDPQASIDAVTVVAARAHRKITVVTGARRGCGVTTVALHLAVAMASRREVCLLDLDPSSSLRARLDLPSDAPHWGAVADDVLSAALPLAGGFRLLLAPPERRGDARRVLTHSAARFEHVVVDAPADPWRVAALSEATEALLVVPPSRQGIAHAREVLTRHPHAPWSCVVSRVGDGGELTARHIGEALSRPVSVELPCSRSLRDREDGFRLLDQPWSRFFRRIDRLATALDG